ncbi:hypothetical protein [Kocuria sp.]|uniref:hypothetical protein n=1 Tax=Kocuria sp. TaxID=1871328 RepID=UPI0026DAA19F|nr:hypothetical protein [Kocuria sp.]MDO4918039.1 hypothetical protein [Kocuria sp.]
MVTRKSAGYLVQGSALLVLFVLTFVGARDAWVVMTMELVLALLAFIGAGRALRAEARRRRRRADDVARS